jgi:hypothetical protein
MTIPGKHQVKDVLKAWGPLAQIIALLVAAVTIYVTRSKDLDHIGERVTVIQQSTAPRYVTDQQAKDIERLAKENEVIRAEQARQRDAQVRAETAMAVLATKTDQALALLQRLEASLDVLKRQTVAGRP